MPYTGTRKRSLETGHLRWLGGVLGLYALAEPLDPAELAAKLPSLALWRYPQGTDVIREGESGQDLFVVYNGEVDVSCKGKHVARLGPGALLGEMGFLMRARRTATVRAHGDCDVIRIPSMAAFLAEYPALKEFLQETAQRRISELKALAKITAPKRRASEPPKGSARPQDKTEVLPSDADIRSTMPLAGQVRPSELARPDPSKPRLSGKYELLMEIGAGGMGAVFASHDHVLDRKVAIKRLRPEIRDDAGAKERFLSEAKIIAKLTHPFIVAIHDAFEEGGEIYLVFDYVEGSALSSLLDSGRRFSLSESQLIFTYVCQAVACAHWNRVFHRDIKPANIMIDRNGYAKVLDFGLAWRAQGALSKLTHKDVSGTLAYMPPEQHLGEFVAQSDVYALGTCLYEMLTGVLPFSGPDFLAQKERMKFVPPTQLAPKLPKTVDELMAAALAGDPMKRISGALPFLEKLKSL